LQLVDDRKKIGVYMPVKGLKDMKLYKEKDVVERMGVKADQIIDYKALAGDASDNYPGVTGIGPKGAITLLEKYNTLEKIYEKINEINPKVAMKLAVGAESAGMSKKLATIVKDVPVTFHLADSAKWKLGSDRVLELFAEIGFKTLTNRVKQLTLI